MTIAARDTRANLRVVTPPTPAGAEQLASLEAEEGVISAIMNNPKLILEANKILKPEYFYSDKTRRLYEACLAVYTKDTQRTDIDVITLSCELDDMVAAGAEPLPIDIKYLLTLYNNPKATPQHGSTYIRYVHSYAGRRSLMGDGLTKITDIALNPQMNLKERFDAAELALRELRRRYVDTEDGAYFSSQQAGYNEIKKLLVEAPAKLQLGKKRPVTGIYSLDKADASGLPEVSLEYGHVHTFLSDTSGGKSSIMAQVAVANAKRGLNTLVFINELDALIMRARAISCICRIHVKKILHYLEDGSGLTLNEVKEVERAIEELQNYPGQIDYVECPGKSGEWILAEALSRHEEKKLDALYGYAGYHIIGVDYLQIMGPNRRLLKSPSRADIIIDNMITLAEIASRTRCCLLITSQVTPPAGHDKEERVRPTLHNAEGSRTIEKKSNMLFGMLLNEDKTSCEFEVIKDSNGNTGKTYTLRFSGATYSFS